MKKKDNESFNEYYKRVEKKEMIRNLLTFLILLSLIVTMFLIFN